MAQRDVFVVGAVRTAVGSFGGSLKDVPLSSLATKVLAAVLDRSNISPEQVGHVVMGNVIPTEPADAYLSRVAAMGACIPKETPSFNVNRLCGSGLQAIISAAQTIALGDAHIAIGAGAESMSRGPYLMNSQRWGARIGNADSVDYMLGILHDPFSRTHMGITAENAANQYGITREMQDALALRSHQRAAGAILAGHFVNQIVPVEIKVRGKSTIFDSDEHVRADTTLEALGRLEPAFKDNGSVTAGNSSGINDGAAALALASESSVRELNLRPLARIVSYAHAGVDPSVMGIGPVPATRTALQRAGLKAQDIAVIEANEAFAAQACAVTRELDLDPERVNPNGSGISLGHPVGATGAIIATKAIYELHRTEQRYALATMCIGGGQGIAVIFERL
jgi:acetyl-CoA C-acetyltransferase